MASCTSSRGQILQDPATLSSLCDSVAGWLQSQGELFGLAGLPSQPLVVPKYAARAQPPAGGQPTLTPTPTPTAPRLPAGLPKQAQLEALQAEIGDCRRCKLCAHRTSVVYGNGDAQARLMFVGEGPGPNEDLQGQPFVGESGKLLDRMIAAMGLRRDAVYVANLVKCRPPRNRDPEADEVAQCEPFLRRQIQIVQPTVLVCLGRFASQALLQSSTRIGVLRGQWHSYAGIPLMPTFHPAYLLRNPADKKKVWADLQLVMARLAH